MIASMVHRVTAAVTLALLITAVPHASAQEPPTVAAGSRVRLHAPPLVPDTAAGAVLGISGQTLSFRRDGEEQPLPIPLGSVALLQVRRVRAHALRGLVTGLAVGATVGAVSAALGPGCGACPEDENASVTGRAAVLGVVGGVLGLLVGAFSPTETWDTVPLDALRPGSGPGGASRP
jgi:hypothetical protein